MSSVYVTNVRPGPAASVQHRAYRSTNSMTSRRHTRGHTSRDTERRT